MCSRTCAILIGHPFDYCNRGYVMLGLRDSNSFMEFSTFAISQPKASDDSEREFPTSLSCVQQQ